jgi:hypothetical protein
VRVKTLEREAACDKSFSRYGKIKDLKISSSLFDFACQQIHSQQVIVWPDLPEASLYFSPNNPSFFTTSKRLNPFAQLQQKRAFASLHDHNLAIC